MHSYREMLSLLLLFVVFSIASCYDIDDDRIYEMKQFPFPLMFSPKFDATLLTRHNFEKVAKELEAIYPKEDDPNYEISVHPKTLQKFTCHTPDPKPKKVRNTSKNPRYYSDLIEANLDGCMHVITPYWLFDICKKKGTITQYHGRKGDHDYKSYSLGVSLRNVTMPAFQESNNMRFLYVEEKYEFGSACTRDNKTRMARRTVVRYYCNPELSQKKYKINLVGEGDTCEYGVNVHVGSLCFDEDFLPPNMRKSEIEFIKCFPYVGVDQIRNVLQSILNNKKRKDKWIAHIRELEIARDVAIKRRAALYRGELATTSNKAKLAMRDEIEMDVQGHWYDLLIAYAQLRKLSREVTLAEKKLLWQMVDGMKRNFFEGIERDEDIEDEMEGNLWYYFHRKDWPKKYFPINYVYASMQQQYFSEILEGMSVKQDGLMKLATIKSWWKPNDFYKLHRNRLVINKEITRYMCYRMPLILQKQAVTMFDYDYSNKAYDEYEINDLLMHFETPNKYKFTSSLPFGNTSLGYAKNVIRAVRSDIVKYFDKDDKRLSILRRLGVGAFWEDFLGEPVAIRKQRLRRILEKKFLTILSPLYIVLELEFADKHWKTLENWRPEFNTTLPIGAAFYNELRKDAVQFARFLTGAAMFPLRELIENGENFNKTIVVETAKTKFDTFLKWWDEMNTNNEQFYENDSVEDFEHFDKEMQPGGYGNDEYAISTRNVHNNVYIQLASLAYDQDEKSRLIAAATANSQSAFVFEMGEGDVVFDTIRYYQSGKTLSDRQLQFPPEPTIGEKEDKTKYNIFEFAQLVKRMTQFTGSSVQGLVVVDQELAAALFNNPERMTELPEEYFDVNHLLKVAETTMEREYERKFDYTTVKREDD